MPYQHRPDHLERDSFVRMIQANIKGLAAINSALLAAPRVIAIDGKWGNGKTWMANELIMRLSENPGQKVVYIDAFRYDHQDDPFPMIASAILKEIKPEEEKKNEFLTRAAAVLRNSAPIAAKFGMRLAAGAVGISTEGTSDAFSKLAEDLTDASGDVTTKAVEELMDRYADTLVVQDRFVAALDAITETLPHPLVVIIDEMDRCRPSFALEVLERIKHLFDTKNVVFVFFWNSSSIHESIRHTYGAGTDADNYISKFVSFEMALPILPHGTDGKSHFHNFINEFSLAFIQSQEKAFDFVQALDQACTVLSPNLRELQKSIQLWVQNDRHMRAGNIELDAYLTLLSVSNAKKFRATSNFETDALKNQLSLWDKLFPLEDAMRVNSVHACLAYMTNKDHFDAVQRNSYREKNISHRDALILRRVSGVNVYHAFSTAAQDVFKSTRAN